MSGDFQKHRTVKAATLARNLASGKWEQASPADQFGGMLVRIMTRGPGTQDDAGRVCRITLDAGDKVRAEAARLEAEAAARNRATAAAQKARAEAAQAEAVARLQPK